MNYVRIDIGNHSSIHNIHVYIGNHPSIHNIHAYIHTYIITHCLFKFIKNNNRVYQHDVHNIKST